MLQVAFKEAPPHHSTPLYFLKHFKQILCLPQSYYFSQNRGYFLTPPRDSYFERFKKKLFSNIFFKYWYYFRILPMEYYLNGILF